MSCVDDTSMTAQFKMLRLEACLGGEAAETIKGLGYTQVAYDAADSKVRGQSATGTDAPGRIEKDETSKRR